METSVTSRRLGSHEFQIAQTLEWRSFVAFEATKGAIDMQIGGVDDLQDLANSTTDDAST